MRRPLLRALVALPLLPLLPPAVARAQRAEAPLVLRIPSSARALAMGGGAAVAEDPAAFLSSPAFLTWSRGIGAEAQRWGGAATSGQLATTTQALAGSVGLAVQFLDYGAGAARYPAAARGAVGALGARGPVNAGSLMAAVGYARTVLGLRSGVTAKLLDERLGAARDGTVAFDVGSAIRVWQGLSVGLALQDVGRGVRLAGTGAPLPTRLTLGAAGAGLPVTDWLDVGASGSVSVLRGGTVATTIGAEAALIPMDGYAIALRAGARRLRVEPGARAFTAGVGLTRDQLSLDYAFEPWAGRAAHRVGIRVR